MIARTPFEGEEDTADDRDALHAEAWAEEREWLRKQQLVERARRKVADPDVPFPPGVRPMLAALAGAVEAELRKQQKEQER